MGILRKEREDGDYRKVLQSAQRGREGKGGISDGGRRVYGTFVILGEIAHRILVESRRGTVPLQHYAVRGVGGAGGRSSAKTPAWPRLAAH